MPLPRPTLRLLRRGALAALLAAGALLGGCASVKETANEIFGRGNALEARLRSPNSAATGVVRVFDSRDGVAIQMSLYSVPFGTYRVALHERGNCSSPNLFSAGPAWAPAGSGKSPDDLLPQFYTNTEGEMTSYNAFIKGARVEGPLSLRGRVVVVHLGTKVGDAVPGLPNNRVACGVLDSLKSLF